MDRRSFLRATFLAAAPHALWSCRREVPAPRHAARTEAEPLFRISLAQWSLHRALFGGSLDNLEFAAKAHELGIGGIEYVNQFFKDRGRDSDYLRQMKQRAEDVGVRSLLIMCDGEGRLGDPDARARRQAVENHLQWLDAVSFLGGHAIRVNAASAGDADEQRRLVADGLSSLAEEAATRDLDVIVENHGGLSSEGQWLASVMRAVDHPRCGTLPDFGNFGIYAGEDYNPGRPAYDRYRGVEEMMPWARALSAKSFAFDETGEETTIDFRRMMRIALDGGYKGWVGIEWEGPTPSEEEGIVATRRLLERIRDELASESVAARAERRRAASIA